MQNRRNILGILGLSAASVVVSTEAITTEAALAEQRFNVAENNGYTAQNLDKFPQLDHPSYERQVAIAGALETLAKNIRLAVERSKNKLPGERVVAIGLSTKSDLKIGVFLEHEVTVKVEIYDDGIEQS